MCAEVFLRQSIAVPLIEIEEEQNMVMVKFLLALAGALGLKCAVFALETEFGIVAHYLPSLLGVAVTPQMVAFGASILLMLVAIWPWPTILPAVIVLSAPELVKLAPLMRVHINMTNERTFWLIAIPLSVAVSLWATNRRELWHVRWPFRVSSQLLLPVALVVANAALYRIYNDGHFGKELLIYAAVAVMASIFVVANNNDGAEAVRKDAEDLKEVPALRTQVTGLEEKNKALVKKAGEDKTALETQIRLRDSANGELRERHVELERQIATLESWKRARLATDSSALPLPAEATPPPAPQAPVVAAQPAPTLPAQEPVVVSEPAPPPVTVSIVAEPGKVGGDTVYLPEKPLGAGEKPTMPDRRTNTAVVLKDKEPFAAPPVDRKTA